MHTRHFLFNQPSWLKFHNGPCPRWSTSTHHCNGHASCFMWLACCRLDSLSPFLKKNGTSNTPFTLYSRLLNQLYNRFDNRLYRVNKQPTGCQSGFDNCFDNRLDVSLQNTASCQTGSQTSLTTVLNEQPLFIQPVVKLGCTTCMTTGCIHDTAGCQTGLTTGCIV